VFNRFEVALLVGQRTEEVGRLLAVVGYETTLAAAAADGEAAARLQEGGVKTVTKAAAETRRWLAARDRSARSARALGASPRVVTKLLYHAAL
jgi:hypothetical protein